FDASDIAQLEREKLLRFKIDYIINCIGITKPFSKDDDPEGVKRAIFINSKFPWELGEYGIKKKIKIIQIATDCVFSGKRGNYNEIDPHDPLDVYGKSKSLGEVFNGSILNIRCSIIGPEIKKQKSYLLEWFLNQPDKSTIGGYEHHIWNGVTTLQFAQICEKIIETDMYENLMKISYIHHYMPNKIVTKFELMNIFNKIFKKGLEINRVNIPPQKIDRTLSTSYHELEKLYQRSEMELAIHQLKKYMEREINPSQYF
ncbi:MAG: sugar nucleotide-binding protein, partial [Candidatus Thorarchaeota archaeon]